MLTSDAWSACPDPIDSSCITDANKFIPGDDSHAVFKLNTDLNTLSIGEQPELIVKKDLTDRALHQAGTYQAVWVIKDSTDHTIFVAS